MGENGPSREINPLHREPNQEVAVPPEIRAMIQTEIRSQLDRERAILRDAGNLALKIVGGAFALLLAIFTIFGLTTWKDIANQTIDYMKQRVDGLIQDKDSETGVKQTLNDLVNRAILAAELTSLRSQPDKTLDLPKFERDRLASWLKFDGLETQEFEDTVAVLNAQSLERKKADANSFLSEMLNPPDASPYRWMVKQPEKRLAILKDFKSVDLGASALAIAQSSSVSEELRIAAIRYLREVKFTDAFDKIIAIAPAADDGPLKTEALLTSAKLRPTNSQFSAELKKLMTQSNSSSRSTAIKIVALLWERGDPFPDPKDAETEMQVMATSKKLLAFAFDGGAYVQSNSFRPRVQTDAFGTTVPTSQSISLTIMVPTSQSSAIGATSFTWETFAHLQPYWELLADAANQGDDQKVLAYMFLADIGSQARSIISAAIRMGTNSSLVVGGATLRAGDAAEILLLPIDPRKSTYLGVQWTKDRKDFNTGRISNFSGGDFKFSPHVATDRTSVNAP